MRIMANPTGAMHLRLSALTCACDLLQADPTNPTPIPTPPTTKAKEVRKVVVESHLVVVDVEKESMPLRQEKNGLTKDKYRTCSRTSKKNGNREANLTQFPTLGLSGRKQSPSG